MNKKLIFSFLAVAVISAAFGRYFAPAKVITKTEIKTVEVVKWKESKEKKEDRDKVTIITEETRPDGTKIVRKEIRDKSQVDTNTEKSGDKSTTTERKDEKIVEYGKTTLLTLYGGSNLSRPQDGFVYGLGVNSQILGPIWLGASVHTNKFIHIGLGLNF